MNTFIVNRPTPGGAATKDKIIDDKIPIYDSKADAEADIANIEENAIVATKDTGATEKVVDVVQDGNMNPVTSNAVADMFTKNQVGTTFNLTETNQVAPKTGFLYITFIGANTSSTILFEDDVQIVRSDMFVSANSYLRPFTIFVRKGHQYRFVLNGNSVDSQYFVPFGID